MVLFINKTMCYQISSEVGFVGHRDVFRTTSIGHRDVFRTTSHVFRTLSTNYDGSFLQK